jgi:O-antigen ligase
MATRRFLEMVIVGPQVLSNPWIGHGLGATYVIAGFAVLDAGTRGLIDHHFIHNLYLVTAFRMGVIGLGLLVWVLFRYFLSTLGAYRKMPLVLNKALVAGFAAGIIGQLVLSFTQPTVIDHPTCALIACAMALSLRLVPTVSTRRSMELKNGV